MDFRLKKITIFTGSRADYSLLKPLISLFKEDEEIDLNLIVSGSHLSREFGNTWKEIKKDGFNINFKIRILTKSDSPSGILESMSNGLKKIANVFEEDRPHLLIVLGDRYEAMVASQAAMIFKIPIAHIHGGESTFGLIDEAIRHSITKMSHLHFAATENYKKRIIQLGENPKKVWNVGAPGYDNIKQTSFYDKETVEKKLNINIKFPLFLVTFHPVTLKDKDTEIFNFSISELIKENGTIIITGANADTNGKEIRTISKKFEEKYKNKIFAFDSLGSNLYLSLMKISSLVVGNSSSGIIEAPYLGVASLDIGERQKGRMFSPSVIHSKDNLRDIKKNLKRALSSGHRDLSAKKKSIYGKHGASKKIYKIIKNHNFSNLLIKEFYDWEK